MKLHLAHDQQSGAFTVSGNYSEWKSFQQHVIEILKKSSHTEAYKVVFGMHTREEHAPTKVTACHMSSEQEEIGDSRLMCA